MLTELHEVHAGPLRAELKASGRLEHLSIDGTELLRGIHVAVRDQSWGTVPGKILPIKDTAGIDTFSTQFRSSHVHDNLSFEWEGSIDGDADGNLRFELNGLAQTDFLANRIGFVVLHSLNWAGRECTLVHTDGSQSAARFPQAVSPWQPFLDLAGIKLRLATGVVVHIDLEGDVFETEDQRNWSDASFKTYSHPVTLPAPVQYRRGDRLHQAVSVRLDAPRETRPTYSKPTSERRHDHVPEAAAIQFHRDAPFPWPAVGVGLAPGDEVNTSPAEVAELHPAHVRVDVILGADGLYGLDDIVRASKLGCALEVAVHVSQAGRFRIDELHTALKEAVVKVTTILVFDVDAPSTSEDTLTLVKQGLDPVTSQSMFAVGTNDYFAELNRNPLVPATMGANAVTFSLTPQVHDTESSAILATVESLPAMVATARSFSGAAKVIVSPITLKPRHNIHVTRPIIDRLLPDQESCDDRQSQPFAAAWFIASLATLAQAGASSLTFVELEGARGLIPAAAHSTDLRYPIFDAFTAIRGARMGISRSVSNAGYLDGVGFTTAAGTRAIVVNLAPRERRINIGGVGKDVSVTLPPYGMRVLDVE